MNVLVAGGAGYIGSHAAQALARAGHDVWVFDNLSTGHRQAVPADRLIVGELVDRDACEQALRLHRIEAVLHFAACCYVGESVTDPAKYYRNNVAATLTLLDAMRAAGVDRIVFSSTTAIYGALNELPIREDAPPAPINPYGFTKRVVEQVLADYATAYGLGSISLRYFNAAGAAADGSLGEDHEPETHLIPLVLDVALGRRENITIFGDDYSTPDGTCVRDYVHVDDLADAHVRALSHVEPGQAEAYNLGTGCGFSVQEVIDAARGVTGHAIPSATGARRAGDPAVLVADAARAAQVLGWKPQIRELDEIIATAWRWRSTNPEGYGD